MKSNITLTPHVSFGSACYRSFLKNPVRVHENWLQWIKVRLLYFECFILMWHGTHLWRFSISKLCTTAQFLLQPTAISMRRVWSYRYSEKNTNLLNIEHRSRYDDSLFVRDVDIIAIVFCVHFETITLESVHTRGMYWSVHCSVIKRSIQTAVWKHSGSYDQYREQQ